MSGGPNIDALPDADPQLSYVRRLLPTCVTTNVDTGEVELIPQKAFVFNPDLSIHEEQIIRSLGSTVEREYNVPPNGALSVPVQLLTAQGAFLKATPHASEPVLGPAHHSLFGASRTPSKTDKAAMRDILSAHSVWTAIPRRDEAA